MRKIIVLMIGILALGLAGSLSCYAGGHGHGSGYGHGHGGHYGGYYPRYSGGIWIGPGWGAVWPGPFYPFYYPYYPYRYYAPRVAVEPREEGYITQSPGAEGDDFWYFCRKPEGYYPYVNKCPGGWMKVVPPPEAPQGEE
jgi:hypothetical protein